MRAGLEASLNADLTGVRVHTGRDSAAAADGLSARAFSYGNHVHFGEGRFRPSSRDGLELIAHEVVHTLQSGAREALPGLAGLSSPTDASEREAGHIAHSVVTGGPVPASGWRPQRSGVPVVQRTFDHKKAEADRVARELRAVIAASTWKEIRKRVYPQESAAGIRRAQARHEGTRSDLTGLGRLATLDRFAGRMRDVQKSWPPSPDARVKKLGAAANAELAAADVPVFLALDKEAMDAQAFFDQPVWRFVINQELVQATSLTNDAAAGLANATLHESRHAEQAFLSARFSAGKTKQPADALAREQQIPRNIAAHAIAKKFDAKTDPATAALGAQMFQAGVTDAATNQATSDAVTTDLNNKRARAESALAALEREQTSARIAEAKRAKEDLEQAVPEAEKRYKAYRAIPYEADAHEVGDAAEQAFRGWPGSAAAPPKGPVQ